jgi:hypothetical protein
MDLTRSIDFFYKNMVATSSDDHDSDTSSDLMTDAASLIHEHIESQTLCT